MPGYLYVRGNCLLSISGLCPGCWQQTRKILPNADENSRSCGDARGLGLLVWLVLRMAGMALTVSGSSTDQSKMRRAGNEGCRVDQNCTSRRTAAREEQ
jgi:hypothetical protein